MKKKIYGKPIWGTDWSLRADCNTMDKASEIANSLSKTTGTCHKAEQYPGKNIFQVWVEIAPLDKDRFS